MKLQPYKFKIVYHAGVKHVNADTITRPPIVSNTDIMAIIGETRVKQAAAIKGRKFMQQVATDPFGDMAHVAACQVSLAPEPVEETPAVLPPKWPLDEEWECSWLANEDWFQEPLKLVSMSGEQSRGQGQPDKTDEGEHGQAVAHEECGQATPEGEECGQAATHKECKPAGQAAAHKAETSNLMVNLEQEQ
jgi:hypothetical protein